MYCWLLHLMRLLSDLTFVRWVMPKYLPTKKKLISETTRLYTTQLMSLGMPWKECFRLNLKKKLQERPKSANCSKFLKLEQLQDVWLRTVRYSGALGYV